MTIEEEYNHIRNSRLGIQSSINKLVSENDGLIRKYIVKLKLNGNYTYDDAYQDGVIGVIEAIRTFDLETGFRFSTWCSQWIKAQIYRQMLYQDQTVKRPADYNKMIREEGMPQLSVDSIDCVINENGDTFAEFVEDPKLLAEMIDPENLESFWMALEALPDFQHSLILFILDGKTYEWIANELGSTISIVKNQRRKAIEEMKWKIKIFES